MWKRRRSTDKRYSGDNRLISPKSPHRRGGLAPRCRLIASWGWSRSQGLGCSPIKAVRELGLERRETVRTLLSINSAKCWKIRVSPGTRLVGGSENPWSADNQQERPHVSEESSETIRRTSRCGDEDIVRAAWRHAESGRNDRTLESAGNADRE